MNNMLYNIFDAHNYLVIIHDGDTYTINKDNTSRYDRVKEHLLNREFDQVGQYLWTNMFEDYSDVVIEENNLFYKNKKVPSTLADILFEKRKEDENVTEHLKFFDSLEYNDDFKNNKIKKIKFYKSLSSVYPLGDVALYDSQETLNIKGMKSLQTFNSRFIEQVKLTKNIELALESIAGFKSKNLIKLFKKEIIESNNCTFVDYLVLVKDLLEPNLMYSLWDKIKDEFKMKDPFFLNQFLILNKKSDIGIFNYLLKNKSSELMQLNSVLRQYPEVMMEVPELTEAVALKDSLVLYHKRKLDASFDLFQERSFPEIKNCVLDIDEQMKLCFPENKDELANWSSIMSNCIATYSKSARDGHCLLVGVLVNDVLKYTIEINTSRALRQFVSYGNGRVATEIKTKVIQHLRNNLILKS